MSVIRTTSTFHLHNFQTSAGYPEALKLQEGHESQKDAERHQTLAAASDSSTASDALIRKHPSCVTSCRDEQPQGILRK
jgi:hypothetical protein